MSGFQRHTTIELETYTHYTVIVHRVMCVNYDTSILNQSKDMLSKSTGLRHHSRRCLFGMCS